MAKIKITLVKSPIGYEQGQRAAVQALGLRHVKTSVIKEDTPTIRGQVFKVRHLLVVEEVQE